jgi:hypothetical protein
MRNREHHARCSNRACRRSADSQAGDVDRHAYRRVDFREWVVNVGRRDSRTRIAHLLCELALRLKNIGADHSGMVDFPLTQEQLAD